MPEKGPCATPTRMVTRMFATLMMESKCRIRVWVGNYVTTCTNDNVLVEKQRSDSQSNP